MATRPLCIPVDQWPEGDRALWQEAFRPKHRFRTAGVVAGWAAVSRNKVAQGYGRYLRFLIDYGVLDPDQAPEARVTPEWVNIYIAYLGLDCAPRTIVDRIQELRDALRVLAPFADLRWLTDLYLELDREAVPVCDKRSRLRPARALWELGLAMMHEAENAAGWSALRRARQYRDGLLIAFLVRLPIRAKNLASIRLGTQLVSEAAGWWITFKKLEMKNRRPFSAPFPRQLYSALERYLEAHRPVLIDAHIGDKRVKATDALWVSDLGTMYTQKAMSARITNHTKAAFGGAIPPHWFRDCVGTTIAVESPEHVHDVPIVLGHADPKTAHKYYILATGLEASRSLGKALAPFREPGKIASHNPETP